MNKQCICQVKPHNQVDLTTCARNQVGTRAAPNSSQSIARLHIRIDNMITKENRFSIEVPPNMINTALSIAQGFSKQLDPNKWSEIQTKMRELCIGQLLDERDEKTHERIQIYISAPLFS